MRARLVVAGFLPFLAACLCCFFVFFLDLHLITRTSSTTLLHSYPQREFSLLIGILTRPDNYGARHFLRLVYGTQSTPTADVDVRFVFCNLTKEEQRVLVAMEIIRFGDVIVLDCAENMNAGKTYAYFSSLPGILPRRYDYVMKADDDVFIRVGELAASLRPLPREDLYYGFVIPCAAGDARAGRYMSGMGYVLSWDLVEWIAGSGVPAGGVAGPEDKLVGRWLDAGGKARNRHTAKPVMYDYPGSNGRCSHELVPETVAVHRLKTWDRWMRVLRFFNVTAGLQPSKLYHIH